MRELKHDLPDAILKLQRGSIAPVDLAQASIGPRNGHLLHTPGSSKRMGAR